MGAHVDKCPEVVGKAVSWAAEIILGLKIVSIKDLITYRMREESLIEETETISLPTKFGKFKAIGFRDRVLNGEYVALVKGDIGDRENMLVRVHSGCVFHSIRCDCGG